jgi:hypothetical protein
MKNDGRGEFNYDIFDVFCKNFCKCHNNNKMKCHPRPKEALPLGFFLMGLLAHVNCKTSQSQSTDA